MAVVQDFVSSHSPVKNFHRKNLTGKEWCGYGDGCQYCGSYGTGNHFCYPCYSLFGGMPTAGFPHSLKETYNGWSDIVGKISTGGFLVFFNIIFTFV